MGDGFRNRRPYRRLASRRPAEITAADIVPGIGHNGGPPLDEHVPPWGKDGIGNWFDWRAAVEGAFRKVPAEIAVRRARKAEALGLTYREYQLEILERGRYLQADDTDRIAQIIAARKPQRERV
jgi:hypothetical protein